MNVDPEDERMITELEGSRNVVEALSTALPDDRDFWPACAASANDLEGRCSLESQDNVRGAIGQVIAVVRALPRRDQSQGPSPCRTA
jgi:hypothetical protein